MASPAVENIVIHVTINSVIESLTPFGLQELANTLRTSSARREVLQELPATQGLSINYKGSFPPLQIQLIHSFGHQISSFQEWYNDPQWNGRNARLFNSCMEEIAPYCTTLALRGGNIIQALSFDTHFLQVLEDRLGSSPCLTNLEFRIQSVSYSPQALLQFLQMQVNLKKFAIMADGDLDPSFGLILEDNGDILPCIPPTNMGSNNIIFLSSLLPSSSRRRSSDSRVLSDRMLLLVQWPVS